jgi:hypothetical protein
VRLRDTPTAKTRMRNGATRTALSRCAAHAADSTVRIASDGPPALYALRIDEREPGSRQSLTKGHPRQLLSVVIVGGVLAQCCDVETWACSAGMNPWAVT